MIIDKFQYQEAQYSFPYHYLTSINEGNTFKLHRQLSWGMEYMTYMTFVADQIRKLNPRSVLDVGCGDGRLVNMIAPFIQNVQGIDLSERAIAFARAFNPDVLFHCKNVEDMEGQFEMICLIEVMEHIPDQEINPFMLQVDRLLETGGHLLISVPSINVPVSKKHYRHYSLELVKQQLPPGLQIEQCWWLYNRNGIVKFFQALLRNRFFVLNSGPVLRFFWKLHNRFSYVTTPNRGSHLVCLAKKH